ncbi:MAG: replication initiator protein [Microvirus sp.]|nr:MAG: replication initiator protein [Microvirus sp.]
MQCGDPVLCYTKTEGKKIYRNFSFVKKNTLFLELAQQVFDCGKCQHCRKEKSRELAMRCVLHSSLYKQNSFITLTYDEKKQGYHNKFQYTDIQKFKKRLRKHCKHKKIEIFNVHEYGQKGKKHWHLICFNHDFEDKDFFTMRKSLPLYTSKTLSKLWTFGFSSIGDVSEASAMYQAQYMEKDFKNNNIGTSKKSHSKHSGIARPFFLQNYSQILRLGYVPFSGQKIPLPRYFEKLAHKHYCHFNEQSAFYDTITRKKLYRPFKLGEENIEISRLYKIYIDTKQEKLKQKTEEWKNVISQYLTTKEEPDFIKSLHNTMHDITKRNIQQTF